MRRAAAAALSALCVALNEIAMLVRVRRTSSASQSVARAINQKSGTNRSHRRSHLVEPQRGHFFVGVSMMQSDFFQNEAKRCRDNAVGTARKDRKFWLNLADRRERLLHPKDESDGNVGAIHTLRPRRTIYNKRRRVAGGADSR
jgi:hypothetical protein